MGKTATFNDRVFYLPYMQQGSSGHAAVVLGLFLAGTRFDPQKSIHPDGDFTPGGEIAKALIRLQEKYGLEPDGHFGPQTRKAFELEFGFHPDNIPCFGASEGECDDFGVMVGALFTGTEFDPEREILPDGYFPSKGKIAQAIRRLSEKYAINEEDDFGPQVAAFCENEFGFKLESVPFIANSNLIQPK